MVKCSINTIIRHRQNIAMESLEKPNFHLKLNLQLSNKRTKIIINQIIHEFQLIWVKKISKYYCNPEKILCYVPHFSLSRYDENHFKWKMNYLICMFEVSCWSECNVKKEISFSSPKVFRRLSFSARLVTNTVNCVFSGTFNAL